MIQKKIFLVLFFALLSFIIIAPFMSKTDIRDTNLSDLVAHVGAVVQSKMALDEGQFPPRVGPYFQNNFGNPVFQFYAPLYFTIVGFFHKILFPDNPYSALNFLLGISLIFSGIFFYRLIYLLTQSENIAFLAAFSYLASPYLLSNIHSFSHTPEITAQCLLTAVLYYCFKIYFLNKNNISTLLLAGIFWFSILTIHPITFVYLSLSLALLFIIITLFEKKNFKNLIWVGVSYIIGILLSSFYFFPVIFLTKYLLIGEHSVFTYFPYATFLSPLFTLLSMYPTSPMPLPGNGWLNQETRFYLSIGFPLIISILGMFSVFLFKQPVFTNKKIKILSFSLLCVCIIVFFATWSPFNFWIFLPKIFQIGQFTYRFLVQLSWVGSLLFAMTLYVFFKKQLNLKYTIFGFVLIVLSLKPWFETKQTFNYVPVKNIIAKPEVPGAQEAYLMLSEKTPIVSEPLTMPVSRAQTDCTHVKKYTICNLVLPLEVNNVVQLPIFYYPDMLNIKVNGQKVNYFATQYDKFTLVGLVLPRGTYTIESYFQGLPWANWMSVFMWIMTIIILCFNWCRQLVV